MKGQGGVFVRLPKGGTGFLRQVSGLAPGQRLLVQVSGVAEPGKAVPVTARLLFKSRLCILTPGAPGLNISRRIRDEALREELSAIAAEAMTGAADDLGLILRSACETAPDSEIAAEIVETRALAEAVLADVAGEPELLVDAPGAHQLAWRDWSDPSPDEIDETEGAFERHGVAEACEALLSAQVPLGGGAHMAVEPTRALVAVDVNTGSDTSPAAALKANVAAARELPRSSGCAGWAAGGDRLRPHAQARPCGARAGAARRLPRRVGRDQPRRLDPARPLRTRAQARPDPADGASDVTCPICGRPAEARYRPFCSRRCADVDLGHWLKATTGSRLWATRRRPRTTAARTIPKRPGTDRRRFFADPLDSLRASL